MKKIILLLSFVLMILITKPMFADSPQFLYNVLDNGVGLNKLNPDDILYEEDQGKALVYLNGAYIIPANTVYAVYASYDFVGDITKSEDCNYGLWDVETQEFAGEDVGSWQLGGWYAHTYIHNTTEKDCYLYIYDFGVHYGYLSKTAKQNVIMQEVKNPNSEEFEGFEYRGYVPFHSESQGYELSNESRTLTVVEGRELTEEDFKDLLILEGFYGSVEPISIESNYESTPGEYTITYNYEGYDSYVLNVKVIADVMPELDGPGVITINVSDWSNYTKEDLFSKYTPIYGTQDGIVEFSDESETLFKKAIGFPGSTELELVCTFTGGKVITKTITLQVLNDGYVEIYVKNYILKTSVTDEMTEDEIKDYIDANLSFDLGIQVKDLKIISNAYKGNEKRVGKYEVLYKYRVNNQDLLSTLTIEVTSENSNVNWTNIIIPSVSAILVISMGVILILQRRKQRRS